MEASFHGGMEAWIMDTPYPRTPTCGVKRCVMGIFQTCPKRKLPTIAAAAATGEGEVKAIVMQQRTLRSIMSISPTSSPDDDFYGLGNATDDYWRYKNEYNQQTTNDDDGFFSTKDSTTSWLDNLLSNTTDEGQLTPVEDVNPDNVLATLIFNSIVCVILLALYELLRRWIPSVYSQRLMHERTTRLYNQNEDEDVEDRFAKMSSMKASGLRYLTLLQFPTGHNIMMHNNPMMNPQQNGVSPPRPQVLPGHASPVRTPHPHDVLSGRGGPINSHAGNVRFRKMVDTHKRTYLGCTKVEKSLIAASIVAAFRSQDPAGRFLKEDPNTGLWVEIGDKLAWQKASQALRESAPAMRAERQAQLQMAAASAGVVDPLLTGSVAGNNVMSRAGGGSTFNALQAQQQPGQQAVQQQQGGGYFAGWDSQAQLIILHQQSLIGQLQWQLQQQQGGGGMPQYQLQVGQQHGQQLNSGDGSGSFPLDQAGCTDRRVSSTISELDSSVYTINELDLSDADVFSMWGDGN